MADHMVEFPLESGGSIVVMTAAPSGRPDRDQGADVTRGWGAASLADAPTVLERAESSFEAALRHVRPVAAAVLDAMRGGVDAPDEVQVEFGLQLSAEAGAVIATTGVQANFRVTLAWRRG